MLAIVFGIRVYVAKPFIVQGVSMYPTFDSWHYLIIDELTYNLIREPLRGEVIVFHYPGDPSRYFIKRVIGLPGETISIEGFVVHITKADGTKLTLTEPYILPIKEKVDHFSITLSPGDYFVMGDNRAESADSRFFGPLARHFIVGRALVRLFPFTTIGYLPGTATYNENQ